MPVKRPFWKSRVEKRMTGPGFKSAGMINEMVLDILRRYEK